MDDDITRIVEDCRRTHANASSNLTPTLRIFQQIRALYLLVLIAPQRKRYPPAQTPTHHFSSTKPVAFDRRPPAPRLEDWGPSPEAALPDGMHEISVRIIDKARAGFPRCFHAADI